MGWERGSAPRFLPCLCGSSRRDSLPHPAPGSCTTLSLRFLPALPPRASCRGPHRGISGVRGVSGVSVIPKRNPVQDGLWLGLESIFREVREFLCVGVGDARIGASNLLHVSIVRDCIKITGPQREKMNQNPAFSK